MRVQIGDARISRWWLLLNSDPEPAEAVSIGCKTTVGLGVLIRTSLPQVAVVPPPVPGGLVAVLGEHAALIGAALVVLALIHFVGVVHQHMMTRRLCALLSSFWWLFSLYLVVTLLVWHDARAGIFLNLWLISTWTSWRLWRPGVRGATNGGS